MAKFYLAIPTIEEASERVFSAAGNVLTKKRALFFPDTVDQIIFLNKNYKLDDEEQSMIAALTKEGLPRDIEGHDTMKLPSLPLTTDMLNLLHPHYHSCFRMKLLLSQ